MNRISFLINSIIHHFFFNCHQIVSRLFFNQNWRVTIIKLNGIYGHYFLFGVCQIPPRIKNIGCYKLILVHLQVSATYKTPLLIRQNRQAQRIRFRDLHSIEIKLTYIYTPLSCKMYRKGALRAGRRRKRWRNHRLGQGSRKPVSKFGNWVCESESIIVWRIFSSYLLLRQRPTITPELYLPRLNCTILFPNASS